MKRITIRLPPSALDALDAHCRRTEVSRSEVLRRALDAYLGRAASASETSVHGMWRDRDLDGRDYEDRLREEWHS